LAGLRKSLYWARRAGSRTGKVALIFAVIRRDTAPVAATAPSPENPALSP